MGTITIVALGDLMLAGEWDLAADQGSLEEALEPLAISCSGGDVVIANLEATLEGNEGVIPKQPRLIGRRSAFLSAIRVLGLDVVSLANNHAFDSFFSGFEAVRELLRSERVRYLGAGRDAREAAQPLILERQGSRLGFLAFTALDTEPSHVAGTDDFGVNPLVDEAALDEVEALSQRVDHTVVSVHWGVEYCNLPSPIQVQQARRLIDSGASVVLGHHAHVVQGVEEYGGGVIAYNLGNAMTTDLKIDGRLAIRQTPRTRSSFALQVTFSKDRVEGYQSVPFRMVSGMIVMNDSRANHFLAKANQSLAGGISEGRWRRRRVIDDVGMRTLRKLHPKVIRSLRPGHAGKLIRNLFNSVAGKGPA